jgi:preprotein translocase subunit YajC
MLKTETYFSIFPLLMLVVVPTFTAIEHEREQEQEYDDYL